MTEIEEVVTALSLSIGLSILIIGYHISRSYKQAEKDQIKVRQTKSFSYVLGGIIGGISIIFLLLIVLICFGIFKNIDRFLEIAANVILFILFLFPVLTLLFGFFYNKYFRQKIK